MAFPHAKTCGNTAIQQCDFMELHFRSLCPCRPISLGALNGGEACERSGKEPWSQPRPRPQKGCLFKRDAASLYEGTLSCSNLVDLAPNLYAVASSQLY